MPFSYHINTLLFFLSTSISLAFLFQIFAKSDKSAEKDSYGIKKVFHVLSTGICKALCVNRDGNQAWVAVGSFIYCFQLNDDGDEPTYILKGTQQILFNLYKLNFDHITTS